ncbi:hypothetical protein EON77_17870, partial [bacterium]
MVEDEDGALLVRQKLGGPNERRVGLRRRGPRAGRALERRRLDASGSDVRFRVEAVLVEDHRDRAVGLAHHGGHGGAQRGQQALRAVFLDGDVDALHAQRREQRRVVGDGVVPAIPPRERPGVADEHEARLALAREQIEPRGAILHADLRVHLENRDSLYPYVVAAREDL